MEVWNGELYDAGYYKKIYRTRDSKVIAERNNWVYALAVWNGELYDAGDYERIYRTRDSKVIVDLGKTISCMRAVPRSVLKGLI